MHILFRSFGFVNVILSLSLCLERELRPYRKFMLCTGITIDPGRQFSLDTNIFYNYSNCLSRKPQSLLNDGKEMRYNYIPCKIFSDNISINR